VADLDELDAEVAKWEKAFAADESAAEELAYALADKIGKLMLLERYEQAVACSDELLVHFDDTADPEVRAHPSDVKSRQLVAEALRRKAFVLHELGRRGEAKAIRVDLIARFED